jgi:hypothetical protein
MPFLPIFAPRPTPRLGRGLYLNRYYFARRFGLHSSGQPVGVVHGDACPSNYVTSKVPLRRYGYQAGSPTGALEITPCVSGAIAVGKVYQAKRFGVHPGSGLPAGVVICELCGALKCCFCSGTGGYQDPGITLTISSACLVAPISIILDDHFVPYYPCTPFGTGEFTVFWGGGILDGRFTGSCIYNGLPVTWGPSPPNPYPGNRYASVACDSRYGFGINFGVTDAGAYFGGFFTPRSDFTCSPLFMQFTSTMQLLTVANAGDYNKVLTICDACVGQTVTLTLTQNA